LSMRVRVGLALLLLQVKFLSPLCRCTTNILYTAAPLKKLRWLPNTNGSKSRPSSVASGEATSSSVLHESYFWLPLSSTDRSDGLMSSRSIGCVAPSSLSDMDTPCNEMSWRELLTAEVAHGVAVGTRFRHGGGEGAELEAGAIDEVAHLGRPLV
jgi:hypothetical protein